MATSRVISASYGLVWSLNRLFLLPTVLPLYAILLLSISQTSAIQRVLVDLDALPEPFDNGKLPSDQQNAMVECYDLIGCFEPVPLGDKCQDPLTIQTQFLFDAQDHAGATVDFIPVENCLRNNADECKVYPFDLRSFSTEVSYKVSRRTIIMVSGYMTDAPTDWEMSARSSWLDLEDVNVITVRWTGGNRGSYRQANYNTRIVARQITVLLYYLAQLNGLDIGDGAFAEKIYMIGDSLGAHIAGFVGQDLAGGLGRITGLEPAGPDFDSLDARFRLNPTCAQLVDVLHTNAGASISYWGTALAAGHIDLYANDGTTQPGCSHDIMGCSHGKANKYYAAFLRHELKMREKLKDQYSSLYRLNAYIGVESYHDFVSGTSLANKCPGTVLGNANLYSRDIGKCSVPVDYFSWYDQLRDELRSRHGIDFDGDRKALATTNAGNKYYFYTKAETDEQFEHYVAKIRVFESSGGGDDNNRPAQNNKEPGGHEIVRKGFTLNFRMANGVKFEHKVDMFAVSKATILVPYLSGELQSDYEIARLASEGFYVVKEGKGEKIGDIDKLREAVEKIFPASITLDGLLLLTDDLEKMKLPEDNSSWFNKVWNAISFKGNTKPDVRQLQSFVVQPLRRFHRGIMAEYKLAETPYSDSPKLVLMSEKSDEPDSKQSGQDDRKVQSDSKIDDKPEGDGEESTTKDKPAETKKVSHLVLDTVYIGPFDDSLFS